MWVQPALPSMLSLKILSGSITALNNPSSVLLTESTAKSLFGKDDPINKIVRVDNKFDLKVAGVYGDMPKNTTFNDVHLMLPWQVYLTTQDWIKQAQQEWDNHSFQLFAQLSDNADFENVSAKIEHATKPHVTAGNERLSLYPMDKWHLYNNFENGKIAGGRILYVWLIGTIGIFVLILACINFMNLSTARSEKRAKEVGIRKAIGSLRPQLIIQFLSESVVMACLAFLFAIVLVQLFLPSFNTMSDKQMEIPFTSPAFWTIALFFTIFTGLVSGSYPAFYLSGFNTIKVLKGTFRAGRFAAVPRKVLVVLQFTISVTLIIGTIIVFEQIQHAKNRPIGYSRDGLITVDINTPELSGHYDALRNDLLKTGAIENMAESSSPTTDLRSANVGYEWRGKDPNVTPVFGLMAVTHDFGKTIGWEVTQGRDFSRSFVTDTAGMLLNESAAKLMGFKNPVGEIIRFYKKSYVVVGVVKNLVMQSPYMPVQPTLFMLNYHWTNVVTIKLKPTLPLHRALDKIEPVFKQYNPGSLFDFKFTDEQYAKKFSDEERIGELATFFAVLAIFISALGLFGLASFVAEQRTKEIGVRKVLGASVLNLWGLLSKDFLTLVIISCFIAIPVARYAMDKWLQHYVYRIEISWWIFSIACAGAMIITLLTISAQAIKAALANPVKSLRTE